MPSVTRGMRIGAAAWRKDGTRTCTHPKDMLNRLPPYTACYQPAWTKLPKAKSYRETNHNNAIGTSLVENASDGHVHDAAQGRSGDRLWIMLISISVNSDTSPDIVDVDRPLGLSASSAVTKVQGPAQLILGAPSRLCMDS